MAPPQSMSDLLLEIKQRNRWQEGVLLGLIAILGVTGTVMIGMSLWTFSARLETFIKLVSSAAVTALVYFPINKLQEVLEVERGFFLLARVLEQNAGKVDGKLLKKLMDFVLALHKRVKRT